MAFRERLVLISSLLFFILCMWFLLSFLPQNGNLNTLSQKIAEENKKTAEVLQKKENIEKLAKENTVIKLVQKYKDLKKEEAILDQKLMRYDQRFISNRELARLLYSMLLQTRGVSIESFSNIDHMAEREAKIMNTAIPAAASSSTSHRNNNLLPGTTSNDLVGKLPPERTQYKLTLKGNYFSILNYLARLERLKWQLYWDKLEYKVEQYPTGIATIEFYTLKPTNAGSLPSSATSSGTPND
ncbi:hypothetical protein [Legionella adelaidensis]|nr:hypothetical protein [Legionella adelaidensis]